MQRSDVFALTFPVCMAAGMVLTRIPYGTDFRTYIDTANGFTTRFFYPYWILPLFQLLALLPYGLAFILWTALTSAALFGGVKLLGGNVLWVMFSYQALWCLWYGQIVALVVLGAGLAYRAVERRNGWLLGAGLLLLMLKPQVGLAPALVFLWYADWLLRERALLTGSMTAAFSLLIYPGWAQTYMQALASEGVIMAGSIGLWPYALPLWILLVLPRWNMRERLIVACVCSALALPYFQHSGLLLLFALSPWWVAGLGNAGYAFLLWSWPGLSLTMVAPLAALVRVFRGKNNPSVL